MSGPVRRLRILLPDPAGPRPPGRTPPGLTRRRFLAGLGVLAAGAVCGPLLSRVRTGGATTVRLARPGLGTWIRIVARDPDGGRAARAVDRAFAAIAEVDAQMSIHRPDSQIARVNAAAGRGVVAVDPPVLEVVDRARAAAERSGGVYDPTVLPLMRLYGFYGQGRTDAPGDREIARTLDAVGWRHVRADRSSGTLGLARAGAGLDLGSIGKGWAVDRAVAALRAEGIESGLVDVGRNVYGLGVPGGREVGWPVGVVHPATGAIERVFLLRDSAVATSGNGEQRRRLGDRWIGHLLDARRGRPADGPLSATVEARAGVDADALSTVAFLLGQARPSGWPEALAGHLVV